MLPPWRPPTILVDAPPWSEATRPRHEPVAPEGDPSLHRAAHARRSAPPTATDRAVGEPRHGCAAWPGAARRSHRSTSLRSRRRAPAVHHRSRGGTPRPMAATPWRRGEWSRGNQPRSGSGARREARSLRLTVPGGPWSGARRGWSDRRGCASGPGSRGSWPDGGCSAGRSACSRWSLIYGVGRKVPGWSGCAGARLQSEARDEAGSEAATGWVATSRACESSRTTGLFTVRESARRGQTGGCAHLTPEKT